MATAVKSPKTNKLRQEIIDELCSAFHMLEIEEREVWKSQFRPQISCSKSEIKKMAIFAFKCAMKRCDDRDKDSFSIALKEEVKVLFDKKASRYYLFEKFPNFIIINNTFVKNHELKQIKDQLQNIKKNSEPVDQFERSTYQQLSDQLRLRLEKLELFCGNLESQRTSRASQKKKSHRRQLTWQIEDVLQFANFNFEEAYDEFHLRVHRSIFDCFTKKISLNFNYLGYPGWRKFKESTINDKKWNHLVDQKLAELKGFSEGKKLASSNFLSKSQKQGRKRQILDELYSMFKEGLEVLSDEIDINHNRANNNIKVENIATNLGSFVVLDFYRAIENYDSESNQQIFDLISNYIFAEQKKYARCQNFFQKYRTLEKFEKNRAEIANWEQFVNEKLSKLKSERDLDEKENTKYVKEIYDFYKLLIKEISRDFKKYSGKYMAWDEEDISQIAALSFTISIEEYDPEKCQSFTGYVAMKMKNDLDEESKKWRLYTDSFYRRQGKPKKESLGGIKLSSETRTYPVVQQISEEDAASGAASSMTIELDHFWGRNIARHDEQYWKHKSLLNNLEALLRDGNLEDDLKKVLDVREKEIMDLKYAKNFTLLKIAKHFGKTEAWASIRHKKILEKLLLVLKSSNES